MNKIVYDDRTFESVDITSGDVYETREPLSASLETDSFSFEVTSDDTTLTDFTRNTPVSYYYDDELRGIYYIQSVKRIEINKYRFSCTSTIGLLDESYHDGGIYTGETLAAVCRDICDPLTVYVKTNIAGFKLYGWLPIATRRENLTQVLFAVGATMRIDRNGAIRVEGLYPGKMTDIGADVLYSGGSVEYATPVTQVIVTEHAYTQSATETTELFKGTVSYGDKITFDEPCYDLSAAGFDIIASGANWATVTGGSGTLTGKKYTHTTRQLVQPVGAQSRELVKQSDSTVKVESATLVSLANAAAVAERLADYYACTERIKNGVLVQREAPGDTVSIYHPYEKAAVTGYVESADITLSATLRADESVLVGYTPPNIGEQEYYDTAELLTGNGTWTVPDGVTSITLVLVGGGQGGHCGKKGESGSIVSAAYPGGGLFNVTINGYGLGKAGKGGDGGDGGAGGKIQQMALSVSPGATYTYSCGTGGEGADYNESENTGKDGTATTFGGYTSASGTVSAIGYTDPLTGNLYGSNGKTGLPGGKGTGGKVDNATTVEDAWEPQEGETITDEDGVQWTPGVTKMQTDPPEYVDGYGNTVVADPEGIILNGRLTVEASYTLGGGAAAGANGMAGGEVGNGEAAISGRSGRYVIASRAADATNGADATKIPNIPGEFGRGGRGGYGGGGASGHGVAALNVIYGSAISSVSGAITEPPQSLGVGGKGGKGGPGAPGCILVYYRIYQARTFGRLYTKDGAQFMEKYERTVIA